MWDTHSAVYQFHTDPLIQKLAGVCNGEPMFFLNQQYIQNSMRSMKPTVDRTHCKVSTAAAGPRHSRGSTGAMQTRAYPLHDWAIIGVLTSHHAPFPVFPWACVSSGANRIHDTAHSCTVHMHAWEPQYPRFWSPLPVCCSSDGVDSNNSLSILKKLQYAAPMFWSEVQTGYQD